MRAHTHTHVLDINIHTHMQICASMTYIKQIHALVNVSVYVCVYVYVYVYAIYIHMHMYTYTYTHRHLNYECMYICTFWHVRFVDSFQCLGTWKIHFAHFCSVAMNDETHRVVFDGIVKCLQNVAQHICVWMWFAFVLFNAAPSQLSQSVWIEISKYTHKLLNHYRNIHRQRHRHRHRDLDTGTHTDKRTDLRGWSTMLAADFPTQFRDQWVGR